jgi:hypothetical protein
MISAVMEGLLLPVKAKWPRGRASRIQVRRTNDGEAKQIESERAGIVSQTILAPSVT